jgi:hypothetical protein
MQHYQQHKDEAYYCRVNAQVLAQPGAQPQQDSAIPAALAVQARAAFHG